MTQENLRAGLRAAHGVVPVEAAEPAVVLPQRAGKIGFHEAGRDAVHAHIGRAVLDREILGYVARVIAGLEHPTGGEISVNGMTPDEARQKRAYGYVFQAAGLYPWRTIGGNIRLPLEIMGYAKDIWNAAPPDPAKSLAAES